MNKCQGTICGYEATWRLTNRGRGLMRGHDVVMLLCGRCMRRVKPRLRKDDWTYECIEEAPS